uniref:N-acetyltransferase domain-containing protein n=1 Tax=Amphora coffeiformis TaxID=265554 RepID=A0A7S3LDP4_9STRA
MKMARRNTLSSILMWIACFDLTNSALAFVGSSWRRTYHPTTFIQSPSTSTSSSPRVPLSATVDAADTTIWTREHLEDYASEQGVVLSLTTLGPAYRAIARPKHNQTLILGYVEGFVRPTGNLLHVDKMEVFRKIVKQSRAENPQEFKGGGTFLGVGLLMGFLCMLHGQEKGCKEAEFLAIDDEDRQHKRLVRYYKTAGFDFIKYVGDDLKDIPDRMVWGGCGTLLRKDISYLLSYWTQLMEKSVADKN